MPTRSERWQYTTSLKAYTIDVYAPLDVATSVHLLGLLVNGINLRNREEEWSSSKALN